MKRSAKGLLIDAAVGAVRIVNRTRENFENSTRKWIRARKPPYDLLYPVESRKSGIRFCFAVESAADLKKVLRLKNAYSKASFDIVSELYKGASEVGRHGLELHGYSDISIKNFDMVVMPSEETETVVLNNCTKIFEETGYIFSIWDAHKYKFPWEGVEFATLKYRNVELGFYPSGGVLNPSYWANWAYINFLKSALIGNGMDVLDIFTGSGCIGFSLRDETDINSISFVDVNYLACESLRYTMGKSPHLGGEIWLSDVMDGVPADRRFDLIVGNPPHSSGRIHTMRSLTSKDPGWQHHHTFFQTIGDYLRPSGKICFLEAIELLDDGTPSLDAPEGSYQAFYADLEKTYPEFRISDVREINKGWHYAIVIEKS